MRVNLGGPPRSLGLIGAACWGLVMNGGADNEDTVLSMHTMLTILTPIAAYGASIAVYVRRARINR